ncbi:MAG: peptide ABC transporter substrate-binding protein [Polymorphobacter sp.]|uniref:peptide ABC transporter substrate-binding protein n=1 Tax=Polymorphobacter sp. TaxID=1909290 RepID=UPI003A889140
MARLSPGLQLLLLALAGLGLIALVMVLLARVGTAGAGGKGVDPETGTITLILETEPPNLDTSITADEISGRILGHVMEGLTRLDSKGNLHPGVAERWEVTETGARFWLRKDALWSDGKPVTAHDFVFAWRNTVDPASGSEYASIMFGIKNAEAIVAGKKPVSSFGARAISDHELAVEFERPIPYFDKLSSFVVLFPIREDFYRGLEGRYASSAETLLYNGPFTMTRWVHGAHIRLERNQKYWNKDKIALNVIDFPYFTTDAGTIINLFQDGKIAMADIGQQNIEQAMLNGWTINSYDEGVLFYLEFNHRPKRLTRNLNLRKAIQYAIDTEEEVNQVIKIPGYHAGKSLFPRWIPGVETTLRKEYPVDAVVPDPEKARRYLALAKKELGLETLPPLMLLTGDAPGAVRNAEYYQATLKQTLGLDVRIDAQIFKQRLAKMLAGDFDMVMAGWSADYADGLAFAELFQTGSGQNRGAYSNPEYDRLITLARTSIDPPTRIKAFARIQQIVVEDAVIIPEYERVKNYVVDPAMQGMERGFFGADPNFLGVRLIEPQGPR